MVDYPNATKSMKKAGELSRFARLRQVKYLTDVFDKTFSRLWCKLLVSTQ
jgi:hypothetical protein